MLLNKYTYVHNIRAGNEGDVKARISGCSQCQQCKTPTSAAQVPLGTVEAKYPFDKLSLDILGSDDTRE